MVRRIGFAVVAALAAGGLSWSSVNAEPAPPDPVRDGPQVYTGTLDDAALTALLALGVDRQEMEVTDLGEDGVGVEVILNAAEADLVIAAGGDIAPVEVPAQRRTTAAGVPEGVFRRYSGEGGIQEELAAQVAAHPDIAELHTIGQTWLGTNIDAVRVTAGVSHVREGRRPTTVYMSAQHAREWITPEMTRRLLDLFLTGYGTDSRITEIIETTEVWFVPVANPDGYDHTFEEDQRLWRKNLRDNDGDGEITSADGVDLNRNFPTRWGYDDEGSSPNPFSNTYRGPSPGSEPETQALDALFARTTPEFMVNYHSAAELLLHGIGWQVATPSPDDVLYEAMVGDDADPAIPGYDPDISAELYTTNGDTDTHMQEAYGTLGFTPEMSTCEAAAASVPDDEWVAEEDCVALGFDFPDDEQLIQAEFEKNIPFALAVAESAIDPDDPVSVVGREAPPFVVDSFDVSYGDPQIVAVTGKRAVRNMRMEYRINGGRTRRTTVDEWEDGERYGFENDDYYAEFRGVVEGAEPGDEVEVWFTGVVAGRNPHGTNGRVSSEPFTYTVAQDTDRPVLVVANEDRNGINPEDTPPGGPPKYVDQHVAALSANGVEADVWNVDTQGVPHDLGVLGHYAAVVWYLGDNRLTQDPEDVTTTYFGSEFPDLAVAERQQYLTIALRDYLNEGGKLVHAGETVGYYGLGGALFGGIYYGLDGAPTQECVVTSDEFSDCLLLADDFAQYYLGVWDRTPLVAAGVRGVAGPLAGIEALFGGAATVDNPIDEVGAFVPTSEVLPPEDFPQFAPSDPVAEYTGPTGPFFAIEGSYAAGADHADYSYMRLARTYDLTGLAAADSPTMESQMSWDTEEGFDHVIVEARTVGQEDWTTLPDLHGQTSSNVPEECEVGYLLETHPNLLHYLTAGDPCLPTGTTGEWSSFTGSSNGWTDVAFDLSAYAGQHVEIVVSYVTDPATGGTGAVLDDTRLSTAGGVVDAEGFEDGLGAWGVVGPPAGSPPNGTDWERTVGLGGIIAGIATADSITFGFGLEQLESDEARNDLVAAVLEMLAG